MDLSSAIVGRVDAVFGDMAMPRHPGAALLVIDHDEIVYRKCYGLADLETQRPITADSSFYLASIAKQFTAMAIMLLAEQGKLSYDDRVSAYFPRFPSWAAEITVRHLLHHTSGLPNYFQLFSSSEGIAEFTRDMADVTNEAVLERLIDVPEPDFPVRSQYAYSNTGYVLLALMVAIVSGQSFADFLKAYVFDPLGMKHTLVYDAARPVLHKQAWGYFEENDQYQRWDYPLLTAGDGGLFSTLDDLFHWDQALNTECLVPKAALAQAFTSGTTNDDTPVGYGFGWFTNVFPYLTPAEREQLLAVGGADLRHVAHGGGLYNYNYIIRLLDTQRTIVVLTNFAGARGPRIRAHQVAEILFSV